LAGRICSLFVLTESSGVRGARGVFSHAAPVGLPLPTELAPIQIGAALVNVGEKDLPRKRALSSRPA
jgi:membrane-associated protease RseP (regulator of RpoE activity)